MFRKLQFYKILIGVLLIALLLGASGSAAWASNGTKNTKCDCCEQAGEQQIVQLSAEDSYLEALKQTPEAKAVEANFGSLLWDQATLRTAEGNPWQVIEVPVENRDLTGEVQLLLAGTQDGKQFRVLVFGLKPDQSSPDTAQGFSGSLKFYTPNGKLAILAVYEDGVLQETVNGTNDITADGLNWDCFLGCIGRNIPPICYGSCVICAGAPGPYDPFCYVCASCIGYGAFVCIVACWE